MSNLNAWLHEHMGNVVTLYIVPPSDDEPFLLAGRLRALTEDGRITILSETFGQYQLYTDFVADAYEGVTSSATVH